MERHEEFQTALGQYAWTVYEKWLRLQRKQVPKAETFIRSRFYRPIMRFVKFAKKVHLPDLDAFLWLMCDLDMPPVLWTNDEIYTKYLEFLDRRANPTSRAETTINTLFLIADAADSDIEDVFEVLTGAELVQLLRERRLSPWILLRSKRFREFLMNNTSKEELMTIQSIIRPEYWKEQFEKRPDVVTTMDNYVREMNL